MFVDAAARVERGKRKTNDDRILIDGRILDNEIHSAECSVPFVAAVCDGCGGYSGGDIAARIVLQSLSEEDASQLIDSDKLAEALEICRVKVEDYKKEHPEYSEMCTTVAGCVFGEEQTLIFHAGDSRVYRYDGCYLAKMTKDHSSVQTLIDLGNISEDEAQSMQNRNIITRCIGVECEAPEIYFIPSPILAGDIYIMCSDGFWGSIGSKRFAEILSNDLSLKQKADLLVEIALNEGSKDNISVCICAGQGEVVAVENSPFVIE